MILPQSFYGQGARRVALALLGKKLVRLWNGRRLAGTIVETEAYCDSPVPDLACHASKNGGRPTARTAVMFGPPGHAFVYFTYGIHWMFNVVTAEEGVASGVLIRALEPIEGIEIIEQHRNQMPNNQLTNGPAKITSALKIDKSHNGVNLYDGKGVIWLEDALVLAKENIGIGPRVGMGKTPEPWFSIPWRYWVRGNSHVSKYK